MNKTDLEKRINESQHCLNLSKNPMVHIKRIRYNNFILWFDLVIPLEMFGNLRNFYITKVT